MNTLPMLKNNSKESSASLPLKVAIVGAGMGGLATPIALSKKGFDVQVYEKAQALEAVGASLSLAPNGLNSLDAIAIDFHQTPRPYLHQQMAKTFYSSIWAKVIHFGVPVCSAMKTLFTNRQQLPKLASYSNLQVGQNL